MTGERVIRRLAAIMAADVVGYSRLMGRDESGTLARLKAHRTERLEPVLARHGGRLVKLTGDGALVEFPSAVDALGAAVEFQQAVAEANRDRPDDTALVFRIGLHLGDLIVDGDDLYGDGVNVAARLEAEAPAGGIVISRNVHDAVSRRTKATFDDLGLLSLKNIEQPVQAFAVTWDPADWEVAATTVAAPSIAAPGPADVPLVLPDKPSIAVLPFQNMSGDPEQEYFADGMVEDIITALSRFKSLFVIARNSSFTYKGRAVDVRQAGRELGALYILEGSVRKAGSRLRITGQLVDTGTGNHIWAERFDGATEDVFDLQDKITSSVAGAIVPQLQQAEILRAQAKSTYNLTARELYWRALAAYHEYTEASLAEAIALLGKAVAADPRFSSAYGTMAWAHCNRFVNVMGDSADAAARGLAAAQFALEIGKDDAYAISAAAMAIGYMGRRHDEGLALVERALSLNADDAMIWHSGGWVSCVAGQYARSIECFKQAIRLSPVDPRTFGRYGGIGHACFYMGNYDEALAWADKALHHEPKYLPALVLKLGATAMTKPAESLPEVARRLMAVRPGITIAQLVETQAIRLPSQRDPFEAAFRKAGLRE